MNKEVSLSSETKYLGPSSDEKFPFKSHIDREVTKMQTISSIFYRIRKVISTKLLVRMYKVHIEPKIRHEVLIYGTASETVFQNFHSHEKKSRVIVNKKSDHILRILDEYFALMSQALYVMELSKILKRCLNGFFPNSSIGNRWIQSIPKICLLPISRNKSVSRSPFYRDCELYNFLKKFYILSWVCTYHISNFSRRAI